jgi:magnesium transporter
MIRIRQSTEAGLEIVEHPVKGCWIDVIHPTADEVTSLPQDLGVPPEFVTAPLKRDDIAHIDMAEDKLYIVVRVPHFRSATANIPYVTIPMGIIVTHEQVVTICRHEHKLLYELSHEHQADLSTAQPSRFVLHLLWSVANNYILYLNEIDKVVEKLEERLQHSLQNREVLELLRYQKTLVHFTTALRANETMLERLRRSGHLEMGKKDEDLLDEVFTENYQAITMSQIASDILSQMMDAFASIISNNLNVVMKFLASVTIILVIPSIIGTLYGMNINLPFGDHPSAFLILVGLSILGSLIVAVIFGKKGWL